MKFLKLETVVNCKLIVLVYKYNGQFFVPPSLVETERQFSDKERLRKSPVMVIFALLTTYYLAPMLKLYYEL